MELSSQEQTEPTKTHFLRDIPESVKSNIGYLLYGISVVSDPAKKLSYTTALISWILGALKDYYESNIPPEYEKIIIELEREMLKMIADRKNPNVIYLNAKLKEELLKLSVSEDKLDFQLALIRDIKTAELTRISCSYANKLFVTNNEAWADTNEIISEIHDHLFRIAIKYNLFIMPKRWNWNLEMFNPLGDGGEEPNVAKE